MLKRLHGYLFCGCLLMTTFQYPGVYINEVSAEVKAITGVSIHTAVFIGLSQSGSDSDRQPVTSYADFEQRFGDRAAITLADGTRQTNYLAQAVNGYFANGGRRLYIVKLAETSLPAYTRAIEAAGKLSEVGVVALPGYSALPAKDYAEINRILQRYAEAWHDRMILLDPPLAADSSQLIAIRNSVQSGFLALYTPWCQVRETRVKATTAVPPSGFIAGVWARVDETRGIYKAPANEPIQAITGFSRAISEQEQAQLNPHGINVLRTFPSQGHLVWGARTLSAEPEWKYIAVRRYASFLERSISAGTQWTVYESNNEALWAMLRNSIANFLDAQWRLGALQGSRPQEAYFVRVDRTTMTQADIDQGHVIVEVGFAPVKPAEFILLRIVQQTRK